MVKIAIQDCGKCPKRDRKGDCQRPGPCIYVEQIANGNTRLKETTVDALRLEKIGEGKYLSVVEQMDVMEYRRIFKSNPKLSKIITMIVGGASRREIVAAGYSERTVNKARKLWKEAREEPQDIVA
jgi:hypothetical protein